MALIRGFDRTATGALNTSSAAPAGQPLRNLGWAITAAGLAHRHNATAGLPAGFVTFRGRAYTAAGAVCFTTSAPSAANSKYINGIRHHINGAMYAKSAAPTATARPAGIERLLYDPADGAVFFNSVA
jgi:hypothetical protein